jgi:NAD(P)H dehydrogenase (quinone)
MLVVLAHIVLVNIERVYLAMKHLILYAHPNPASFAHAILETLQNAYSQAGHDVVIRDLYALNFDPVLISRDFEVTRAGTVPADIATEQAHVAWADAITVIYPVWWGGFPAILKGWVDRVLLYGFAFRYGENGVEGLLKGKRVILVANHGNPYDFYAQSGMHAAMKQIADAGIFGFCGMEVLEQVYFGEVPSVDDVTRKGYLAQIEEKAGKCFAPTPV